MRSNILNSLIHDTNLRFYGVNIEDLYRESGKQIAKELVNDFGLNKSYSFICGFGGNAGDAFSAIINLHKLKVKSINVYLIGRKSGFTNNISEKLFEELTGINSENLIIKQDAYA